MTCCFKRRGILSCTLSACQKIGQCTLSTPISPFFLEWPSAEYTTYTWTYEHQYALCMIWVWPVCTAYKLLYKDLVRDDPETWFCIVWRLTNDFLMLIGWTMFIEHFDFLMLIGWTFWPILYHCVSWKIFSFRNHSPWTPVDLIYHFLFWTPIQKCWECKG